MKRRPLARATPVRPRPPKAAKPSTVSTTRGHSTVPAGRPPGRPSIGRPRRRVTVPAPSIRAPKSLVAPARHVGRIISDEEGSLLDLIDNLLSKGVMLNADLILALADVDLIYVRLSALLCAADRVLPRLGPSATTPAEAEGARSVPRRRA